jgi:hypothetical protein
MVCEESALREIYGFREGSNLEVIEIRCGSVEPISPATFAPKSSSVSTRTFMMFKDDDHLRRSCRRCHVFMIEKHEEEDEEEKEQKQKEDKGSDF